MNPFSGEIPVKDCEIKFTLKRWYRRGLKEANLLGEKQFVGGRVG